MKKITIILTLFCATVFAQYTFTDPRDKKTYKIVKIGNQTWMAENLNYNADGSKCYDSKPANCTKYGKLYDWTTANKACPEGWHLPSNDEWDKLYAFIDSLKGTKSSYLSEGMGEFIQNPYIKSPYTSTTAGKYLKSKNGWDGNDNFSFAALPSGACSNGRFDKIGNGGWWWSSSASELNANAAYCRGMYNNLENADGFVDYKTNFFSVRCLQDNYDNEEKSVLVGIWGDKVDECSYMAMEFLNDGTGNIGSISIKWKTENNRLYISNQSDITTIYNYKISDSTLTLTYNEKPTELKKTTVKEAATAFEANIVRNVTRTWNRLQAAYYMEMNKVGDFKAISFKPPHYLYFSYEGNIKNGIAYLSIKNNVEIGNCRAGNKWDVLMTKDNDLKIQLPKDINCKEIIPCFDSQNFAR
jgi:uncharacterized protein (TIGR02145 family)